MKTSVSKTHKTGIFPKGLVHGFGEKFEILLTFRFMHNTPRKSIWLRSHFKTSLFRQYKHRFKTTQSCFFPKAIVHDDAQKLEVFSYFVFIQNRSRKSVCWRSRWKRNRKDYQNIFVLKTKNLNFCKGVHHFGKKFQISTTLIFIQNRPKKVLGNVLVRKKYLISFVTPCHPL